VRQGGEEKERGRVEIRRKGQTRGGEEGEERK
jgi:hypothetical protein